MSKINFIPEAGLIVVEIPQIEEKTKSGIIKSAKAIEEEKASSDHFVQVVAVPDNFESNIKVGDKILLNASQINMITIDNKQYGLIRKDFIFGRRAV